MIILIIFIIINKNYNSSSICRFKKFSQFASQIFILLLNFLYPSMHIFFTFYQNLKKSSIQVLRVTLGAPGWGESVKHPSLGLSTGLDHRVISSSPLLNSKLGVEPTLKNKKKSCCWPGNSGLSWLCTSLVIAVNIITLLIVFLRPHEFSSSLRSLQNNNSCFSI